jgi:undecaprenyl-diphosphatase
VNILDESTFIVFNQLTHQSTILNKVVADISSNELLKGGVLSAAIWWLWFRPSVSQKKTRLTLISTLMGSLIAVSIARIMILTLPYSPRPLVNDNANFSAPFSDASFGFDMLSSFPSDHATLSICLAFGIYLASKRMGLMMLLYSFIFILTPRIFLGLHYATDILAGAIIGISVIYFVNAQWFINTISTRVFNFSEKKPQTFYALMFLFTYETSDLYIHLRNLVRTVLNVIG